MGSNNESVARSYSTLKSMLKDFYTEKAVGGGGSVALNRNFVCSLFRLTFQLMLQTGPRALIKQLSFEIAALQ